MPSRFAVLGRCKRCNPARWIPIGTTAYALRQCAARWGSGALGYLWGAGSRACSGLAAPRCRPTRSWRRSGARRLAPGGFVAAVAVALGADPGDHDQRDADYLQGIGYLSEDKNADEECECGLKCHEGAERR